MQKPAIMVAAVTPNSCLVDFHCISTAGVPKSSIGILAFESAAAMSRLVSLHHSLSDSAILTLRSSTMRSAGVSYLTSTDQQALLRLAFSDFFSPLDSAAATISRLSSRSRSHRNFALTYARLKSGRIPFSSKGTTRRVKKMEKYISSGSKLLAEMEIHEVMARKKPAQTNSELRYQTKMVERMKEESLWSETFDEVVSIMSRAVIAIFARICVIFGPCVDGLPPVLIAGGRFNFMPFSSRIRVHPRLAGRNHSSSPMERYCPKEIVPRNSCPIIRVAQPAKFASTVGMAGLSLRYAGVVVSSEKLLRFRLGETAAAEGEEALLREDIYRQLPVKMEAMVRRKLKEKFRERGTADSELAKGWHLAVEGMLKWLLPVARDTMTWYEERRLDRRRRLDVRPAVLAIQTFEFSDREKTEAAIVEILVGISCMCWYDGGGAPLRRTATLKAGDRFSSGK